SPEVFGLSVLHPTIRSRTFEPSFRCYHQSRWIRTEGLSNKTFAHLRTIRVGGVNKVDTELDRAPKYANRFIMVLGFSPDAFACNSHPAKPKPDDKQFPCNAKFAGFGCRFHVAALLAFCLGRSFARSHSFLLEEFRAAKTFVSSQVRCTAGAGRFNYGSIASFAQLPPEANGAHPKSGKLQPETGEAFTGSGMRCPQPKFTALRTSPE